MRFRRHRIAILTALICVIGQAAVAISATAAPVRAGGLEFSDELGGFELLSVSGTGTADDPIVLTQRHGHAEPVVLVVRFEKTDPADLLIGAHPNILRSALTAIIINETRLPWIGFDFELQQTRHKPSTYGDGLSFDQMQTFAERGVVSNRFRRALRAEEPYDRLRFRDGNVAPGGRVRFDLNLLDVSPVREFYILLHPRIPLS